MGKIKDAALIAYEAFQREGWDYHNGQPSLEDLEDVLRSLKKTIKEGHSSSETGRLRAIKDDGEITYYLNLSR